MEWDEVKFIPKYDAYGKLISTEEIPLKDIFSTKFVRKTAATIDNYLLNQSLIGYWLLQEVANGEPTANYWGAGYEMITFNGIRFAKLDEYTVIMFAGEFGKTVPFYPSPFSTMMITYQHDAMVIKVVLHDADATFFVPSILVPDDIDTVISNFVPKHKSLIIGFIITDVDTNIEYTPLVVRPKNINE